jgi:hypothetical protein
MTEPEHVLAWAQLRCWVAWLISRYRLTLEDRLPDCWPRHPELIEELWALRAWRAEAYGVEGSGQTAVYWHQALVAFLTNVSTWWAAGCRAGHKTPHTLVSTEQENTWSTADPLDGLPMTVRPLNSIRTDPATEPGVVTMPDINVLTLAQMQALTDAGLARPQHDTIAAFTYYDGSWWAYATQKDYANPAGSTGEAVWFRADDVDLAADHTFYPLPMSAT